MQAFNTVLLYSMKKIYVFLFACGLLGNNLFANEPDSVYLFSYATAKNSNHNGLHFAWSRDRQNWAPVGNEYSFLKCDYGRWGSEKRMLSPYLAQTPDGMWHCVWSLNERINAFAHAASANLTDWGRQTYPQVTAGSKVVQPVLVPGSAGKHAIVYANGKQGYETVATADFRQYATAVITSAVQYRQPSETVMLPTGMASGQVHKVAWKLVADILNFYQLRQYRSLLSAETTKQDAERFAGLKPVEVSIKLKPEAAKPVSDMLMGVFFEDLNYAADGGLYAELVQNRDFEYALSDKEFRDTSWHSRHSWTLQGIGSSFKIDSAVPIHINNLHYALLETKLPGSALVNSGFDGIAVKAGNSCQLSLFSKGLDNKTHKLKASLVAKDGQLLAESILNLNAKGWKQYRATMTVSKDAPDAVLKLEPLDAGALALDMISLFPQKTYKNRPNGLRADLAQTIADIHPRFVRFPGGCVAHGDGLGNIYRWKNTIGPLQSRKPQRNLWGYHQSAGLGYFEYFQFCEDIGAAPVPVIAAGVPCQNSANGGQQGGIPLHEMDAYVQDIFDLVEYANGGVNTVWGSKRAAAGHPAPFNVKYIGIGNEDLISDVFEERFTIIFNAMKQKHPEITVIGTVGPFFEGTDYEQGWQIAEKLGVSHVDEHYYQPPGWFINNQDFYDRYDRNKSKVYLGEYAAHLPGKPNNLETALSEALYLTAIERNGDVVQMASYAPLLAKEGHTQWNPDLIYFNNTTVKTTVGYEVQKLYGHHAGNVYIPASATYSNNQDAVKNRIAYSVVKDEKSGDVIIKLVNMLPVEVKPDITLSGVAATAGQAVRIVLQGNPTDKQLAPVETTVNLADALKLPLPPYSFSVIRTKAGQ